MKPIAKKLCLLMAVAVLLSIAACSNTPQEETVASVVFSDKYLKVADVSPEEWIESLKDLGEGHFVNIYINSDGRSVTLEFSEDDRAFWQDVVIDGLEKLKNSFCNINDRYKVKYSNDYSSIDFYYNLDLPATDALYYVIYFEVYCAFGQLLNGASSDNWIVNFNVYNSDTQKLVTSGSSDTGLSYESSDWEASN